MKHKKENINVVSAIVENYKTFLSGAVAIYLISHENYLWGILSFNILSLFSYYYHYLLHTTKNIFTIIHHFHHETDNLLSFYSGMFLEIFLMEIFITLQYFFNINVINCWIVLFFILMYTSIHNYNYSILKVNNVHKLHHIDVKTNYGPDILDVIFKTKHPSENKVENINHSIINIIVSAIVVLIIKRHINIDSFVIISVFLFVFLFVTSTSLWLDFTRENNKKWYDGII